MQKISGRIRCGQNLMVKMLLLWALAFFLVFACPPGSYADDFVYTVRAGDTLSGIGRDVLLDSGNWVAIAELNNIDKPYTIEPGNVLTIPLDLLKVVPARVRVIGSRGKAQMSAVESAQIKPLKPGVALAAGDKINTRNDASATIGFDDGSKLSVSENSNLELIEVNRIGQSGYSQVVVNLLKGRGEAEVNPKGLANHTFDVHTPSATTSVRGTRFRIGVQSGQTFAEVTEGRVMLSNDHGIVHLEGGSGAVARKGEAPSDPHALLPAPDPGFLPTRISTLPFTIALPSSENVSGYRLQLARNDSFNIFEYDSAASDSLLIDTHVANGRYAVRIHAIDENGLAGHDAYAMMEVDAHPLTSNDVEPADGTVIYGSSLTARWQPGEGRMTRLDLGTDLRSTDGVVSHSVTSPTTSGQATINDLTPGRYQWRLTALSATGREGAPGRIHDVEIRSIPPAPAPVEAKLTFRRLKISWPKQSGAMSYRVEFSRDDEFTEIVDSVLVDDPAYVISRPDPGSYFFRVASVDQYDYHGDWTALPIDVPAGMPWRILLGGAAMLLVVL